MFSQGVSTKRAYRKGGGGGQGKDNSSDDRMYEKLQSDAGRTACMMRHITGAELAMFCKGVNTQSTIFAILLTTYHVLYYHMNIYMTTIPKE